MENANTYVLISQSATLIQQEITKIITSSEFEEAFVTSYDLEETSLDVLLEDVDTISFLAPKKVVIAYHCTFLEAKVPVEESHLLHLERYCQNASNTVLLILTTNKLDERKKIVKILHQQAVVRELKQNADMVIAKQLKDYQIDQEAKHLLKEYCQENLEQLWHECEKLKSYKLNDKVIKKEDIDLLVAKPILEQDTLVFSFVRSLAERNKPQAFIYLKQLQQLGIETFSIFGLLESQYRLLYQIKIYTQKKVSKENMAKQLKVHPFRIQKTMELLCEYTLIEISDMLKKLANLDYQVKSGQIDPHMLLEILIFNQ